MAAERLGPGARERDLSDGGGGLTVFQLERAARELEHRASQRDRARRDDENVALAAMQFGDVLRQRSEPFFLRASGIRIDKQRRADLDDDAAEVREAGDFA